MGIRLVMIFGMAQKKRDKNFGIKLLHYLVVMKFYVNYPKWTYVMGVLILKWPLWMALSHTIRSKMARRLAGYNKHSHCSFHATDNIAEPNVKLCGSRNKFYSQRLAEFATAFGLSKNGWNLCLQHLFMFVMFSIVQNTRISTKQYIARNLLKDYVVQVRSKRIVV